MSRTRTWRAYAVLAGTGVLLSGAAAVASYRLAESQDSGSGAVDFANLTPKPFYGYPTDVAKPPARLDEIPTCQAPENERPSPDLPPLSCRYSGSEPPPGAISTAAPGDAPDKTAISTAAPSGWTVIDNAVFRYTLAAPPDWYSTMRPEGGAFSLFDAVKTSKIALKGEGGLRGGISGSFSARELITDLYPDAVPVIEEHLAAPNVVFGSTPGAVWEELGGHGTAVTVYAAYAIDGIVYEFAFNVADDGREPGAISTDVELVKDILATIRPY